MLRARAALAALAVLAAGASLGACDDNEPSAPAPGASPGGGTGGTLVWALPQRPAGIDPLRAETREAQLVTRQVHEPLVARLAGPFGDTRRLSGLAASSASSPDDTTWRFRLREGVRFQDGTPFDAGAVLANAERWRTTPEGRSLVPGIFAVDAPRPNLVRFLLNGPDPRFDERLGSPRLGIVSPRALRPQGGSGATLRRELASGTGPFELRERDRGGVLVARNLSWWGTPKDLGPALDQVEFREVPQASERVALLEAGDIQVADALGPVEARSARMDPLLEVLPGGPASLGLERSVRGISSAREIPSLAGVWVTTVGGT